MTCSIIGYALCCSCRPTTYLLLTATRAEENLQLQEQVLRLRADVGRERVENASLTERLAQAETLVSGEGVASSRGSMVDECAGVFDPAPSRSILGKKCNGWCALDDTTAAYVEFLPSCWSCWRASLRSVWR